MAVVWCIDCGSMGRDRSSLRRSFKLSLLASIAGLAWIVPAGAQGTINLPSIVVSPTGIPTPENQIASSVSVVTAADIERDQRRTVPDVLRTIPGLNVVQNGGPGGLTSVFIRGTNSNHVKVLIDGVDVSDPSNPGRQFDFGHLQTYDIERIEVLRGPQSGLYGSDAIGGVISVTTKKGEGPPKVRAMVEGGTFDTFNKAAGVSGSQGRFNYSFNVSHIDVGSVPVTPRELVAPGRQPNPNSYENLTASTRLGVDILENLSLNYVARYTDSTLRFTQDDFLGPQAARSTGTTEQFYTRGEAVWSLFDGRFTNRFGAAYADIFNTNRTAAGVLTSNQGFREKYDWRGDIVVAPGHVVLLGIDNETERLRQSTNTFRPSNGNTGGYAELQSTFYDRFFLAANVRYDENDAFGGHTTWRVAPAVITPVTDTKLKATYGTGFKAPTLSQLFVTTPFVFANPNLRPEQSKGFDVGFEQPLMNGKFRFGVTYFNNEIEDLINTTSFPGCGFFCFGWVNVDQAKTQGFESFVQYEFSNRLRSRFDHTYTEARDERLNRDLLRRPRNKYSFQTVWQPIDPLTLSVTAIWVSHWLDFGRTTFALEQTDGYLVVNVAANYTINQYVTAFARVDNLFNERYAVPNGFLAPSLGVFGGIRVANR